VKLLRLLFGRQADDKGIARKLEEHEQLLEEQKRRLARILHLRRERELYERRQRRA